MIEEIPEHELWLTQNPKARASFERGLAEARAGLGKEIDFSAFLEEDQKTDEKA